MVTEPAIRCADREIGYPEFSERAARIAAGLRAQGIGEGDLVALVLRNSVEFLEIVAGARLVGARPVPVNWHLRWSELRHLLADCQACLAFAQTEFAETVAEVAPDSCAVLEVVPSARLAEEYGIGHTGPNGAHPLFEDWLAAQQSRVVTPAKSEFGAVFYTSGTTGNPKGVLRDPVGEGARYAGLAALEARMGIEPGVRTLIPAPLYHTAPYGAATSAVTVGADITIAPRFAPESFLHLLAERAVEQVQVVPTMLVRLLDLPERVRAGYDLSALRYVVHAAAPCPVEVKRAAIDWLGPILYEYYGGTETGIVVWCDTEQWLAHEGTVGAPVDGAAVRIIGTEGAELPAGEAGTVYVRPGTSWPDFTYLGDDAKRRAIELDGYVTLGDMGYLDRDGFLHLTDRATDMIISGGVNIYPAEIEAALLGMPGVRDVAVFGIPDAEYGEAVAAHVEAGAGVTEEDIREYARGRLAGFKVPSRVVLDGTLPREESGKLFKRRLRERYWQGHAKRI
ncbi:AMP-binding protein [Sciscionella marina]|uniref:AMP-binding protein n=1 Tax=Sciscionella marina TaxID=508770 RepID=UPI000380485F|nr:AMP-binding protein [Sciscionella marina]